MNLSKFVQTKTGRYVMSILLGFGLATLFRTVCKGKNCLVYNAPPLDEIENKTYKENNKCYTYKAEYQKCDKNKKTIEIA
jgi:hypothetical protein